MHYCHKNKNKIKKEYRHYVLHKRSDESSDLTVYHKVKVLNPFAIAPLTEDEHVLSLLKEESPLKFRGFLRLLV